MATVTIRAATSNAATVNGTSGTITLPTCQDGDLLYLFLGNNISTATPSADPSGWTPVTLTPQNVRTDNYGYLWRKTAVASTDSGTGVTITYGASTLWSMTAIALLATHDTITGSSKSTDGTILTLPAITPGADDCLRLGFVSNCTRGGTDTPGLTAPAGFTEQTDAPSTNASGNNIETGIYTLQLSGQSGVAQATADVSVPGNAHSGLMYSITSTPVVPPSSIVWTKFVNVGL